MNKIIPDDLSRRCGILLGILLGKFPQIGVNPKIDSLFHTVYDTVRIVKIQVERDLRLSPRISEHTQVKSSEGEI